MFMKSLKASGTRVEQGTGEEMEADPRWGGGEERRRPPTQVLRGEQARSGQARTACH